MEKRRELDILEESLAAKEQELNERLARLRERKKDNLEKEVELKEKMVKSDRFIQDNEIQRERALVISNEETEQLKIKEGEIEELRKEMKTLQKHKEALQSDHKQCQINQFLEKIIEASNGKLNQAKDIVIKHESLKCMLQKLWRRQEEVQGLIEEGKKDIYQFVQIKNEEMMLLQMKIEKLKDKIVKATKDLEACQAELTKLAEEETCRQLEYDRMIDHREQKIKIGDPADDISEIHQYIEDLEFIIAEISKAECSESDLAQATSSTGKITFSMKRMTIN